MMSASLALRHFVTLKRTLFRSEILLASNKHCRKDSIDSPTQPSAYVSSTDTARSGTLPYTILTNPVCTQVTHDGTPPPSAKLQTWGFTCDRGTVTRCHLAL